MLAADMGGTVAVGGSGPGAGGPPYTGGVGIPDEVMGGTMAVGGCVGSCPYDDEWGRPVGGGAVGNWP